MHRDALQVFSAFTCSSWRARSCWFSQRISVHSSVWFDTFLDWDMNILTNFDVWTSTPSFPFAIEVFLENLQFFLPFSCFSSRTKSLVVHVTSEHMLTFSFWSQPWILITQYEDCICRDGISCHDCITYTTLRFCFAPLAALHIICMPAEQQYVYSCLWDLIISTASYFAQTLSIYHLHIHGSCHSPIITNINIHLHF